MPYQAVFPAFSALNNSNDLAASSFVDTRTGQPINAGGLTLGVYADLTEAEANSLSVVKGNLLHAGRYRRVQVEAGAVAANIKAGTVAFLRSTALGQLVVTDASRALSTKFRRGIFLNAVTPGNFCWIQELGDALVLGGAAIQNNAPAVGDLITVSTTSTNGTVDDTTAQTPSTVSIGYALTTPVAGTLFRVQLSLTEWFG